MTENKDIFVVVETVNGTVCTSSLELFSAARLISGVTNGKIIAVMAGSGLQSAAEETAFYGADMAVCADDEALAKYSTALYTDVYCKLIKKYSPDVVMLPASKNGKDMAPRIARRLDTGITANCTELAVEAETGLVSWNMPAPGGIMATILCSDTRPQMGSIVPGAFRKETVEKKADFTVVNECVDFDKTDLVKIIRSVRNEAGSGISISDADIVVAGGRGMGSAENFELVRKLAAILGAGVGASRAATDAEWISHDSLIGQTGKLIRPKLYIACGISGALQHLVGISGAECVVAINSDKNAPIFEVADYAVIGDASAILTALIEALEN